MLEKYNSELRVKDTAVVGVLCKRRANHNGSYWDLDKQEASA